MLKRDKEGNRYWWYIDGELHRMNGPAIEWSNGTKCWYKNGKCHREDGPAIERHNGERHWYINGEEYSEAEYREKVRELC